MADKTQLNVNDNDSVADVVKPYVFGGKSYTAKEELIRVLVANWNEGKKELFRGKLTEYYMGSDTDAYNVCSAAEREAMQNVGKDDLIFWKTMYALDPNAKDFFWKGQVYKGLSDLGRYLFDGLRKNSVELKAFISDVLREELLSQYLQMHDSKNEKMIAALKELECSFCYCENDGRDKLVIFYLAAHTLSSQKNLCFAGREFCTVGELTSYMKEVLGDNNERLDDFRSLCYKMLDNNGRLIPEVESWLIYLGKRNEIDHWKAEMSQ